MTRDQLKLVTVFGLVLVLIGLCSMLARGQEPRDFPPGTVLVSRNLDERENTSPGFWNHLSIATGRGTVIESQAESGGVIETSLEEYAQRAYTVTALYPRDPEVGRRAALIAQTYVGQPFGQLSSIGPLRVFGRKNCVSVVTEAYREASNRRLLLGVRRPDHVFKRRDLLTRQAPLIVSD